MQSRLPTEINQALMQGFLNHSNDSDIRRTHFFNDRYENIYLNETHIPEVLALINEARSIAETLLGQQNLRAGYWFNHMPPGAVTLPHSHDDDDELLSAVYYVAVSEDSGELIIHTDADSVHIRPENSMFVFFKPDVVHEVSENLSQYHRLSIGINFGIPQIDND